MEAVEEPQQITTHPTNRLADKIKLRRAYVRGEGALEPLAAKHGIPKGTAWEWFRAEHWDRLKVNHDRQQLKKLTSGMEEQHPTNNDGSITEQQLAIVNNAILACDDAGEMDKLARAKLSLQEALWIERYGCKPGTQKQNRKNSRSWTPQEPISQPATPPQDVSTPQNPQQNQ